MKTKIAFAGLIASALLVAACTENEGRTAPHRDVSAASAPEDALIGVWAGTLKYSADRDVPYHFTLQPGGAAYFIGGHRGSWRLEGDRVLLGAEFDGQNATFGGRVDGDRLNGELPIDGVDAPFTLERVGLWASVGEPHPATGVWNARFEEDGNQFPCGLIVQPDGMAFLSCEGVGDLARGSWRSQGDDLQISLTMRRGESSDEISFALTGTAAGDTMSGAFDRDDDGSVDGAFRAQRQS